MTREWILLSDADLSTPLDEIGKLFSAANRSHAAIAIGSRAIDRRLVGVRQQAAREWSGRFFNVAKRAITGLPFRDTQCGFKLYCAGQRTTTSGLWRLSNVSRSWVFQASSSVCISSMFCSVVMRFLRFVSGSLSCRSRH